MLSFPRRDRNGCIVRVYSTPTDPQDHVGRVMAVVADDFLAGHLKDLDANRAVPIRAANTENQETQDFRGTRRRSGF